MCLFTSAVPLRAQQSHSHDLARIRFTKRIMTHTKCSSIFEISLMTKHVPLTIFKESYKICVKIRKSQQRALIFHTCLFQSSSLCEIFKSLLQCALTNSQPRAKALWPYANVKLSNAIRSCTKAIH